MKHNLQDRSRKFCFITYLKPKDIIETVWFTERVTNYAFIYHDKDKYSDGEKIGQLKEPHFHWLVRLDNAMSLQAFTKLFRDFEQNTFVEIMDNQQYSFDYLTHRNEPDSDFIHKYDFSEIRSNNVLWWEKTSDIDRKNETAICIIDDLMTGVPVQELLEKYGREIIINWQKYYMFARMLDKDLNGIKNFKRDVLRESYKFALCTDYTIERAFNDTL